MEVREDDVEPTRGIHIAGLVLRVAAIVILLLAIWQFTDWWVDRPPGGAGMTVLVGDTIRLIVVSGLLWAASSLADLMVKSHYDLRATRILMARQVYMLRQWGLAQGPLASVELAEGNRRGVEPEETVPPAGDARPGE
jgi:hypothetical protein